MTFDPVRVGVAGLGRAFMLTLPSFRADPRIQLVAAATPNADSREAFTAEFGGRAYESVEELCTDPMIEAIYVATPHQLHLAHVIAAARNGKHILVDKPLAVQLDDAIRMVKFCREAGVHLIVGPGHSFDTPVEIARKIIESGEFGVLRMIQALNYTDFLYRPRRPEELRTAEGGGVIFSQAVHQIDIVRLLAGGMGHQVFAIAGAWDSERPTEGAYSALMSFDGGTFATLTYSGYAHFDSDVWMDNVGELGHKKKPGSYGAARSALTGVLSSEAEADLKSSRAYGSSPTLPPPQHSEHFGPVIALCDHGDLRLTPDGVHIYSDTEQLFRAAPTTEVSRQGVLNALVAAVRDGVSPAQTGAWGLANLEACHAILKSSETGQPITLEYQVSANYEEALQ